MKIIRSSAAVLARFILSSVFLASSVNKIFHWREAESALYLAISDWQDFMRFFESASQFLASLTPWTGLLLLGATVLELAGGLLVLLGIREKLGASLLILFLIPTSILFHPFWFLDGSSRELETIMFLKNLSIMGGLILLILHGSKAASTNEETFSSFSMG